MSRWEKVRIGDVCTLKSGNSLSDDIIDSNGDIPYVKVAELNLEANTPKITTSTRFVTRDSVLKQIFPIGTVIFPKRGGAIGTNKKRLTDREICADLNIMGVIPNNKLHADYLYYFFQKVDMATLGNGSSVPQINNGDIAPLKIPLPPLETQKQIAKTLDTAAELLATRKQQLAELDNLIKSTFYDMFGDPISNEKGWDFSTVDNVCSKIVGGGTPSKSNNEYYIGNIPWVTPKDMKSIWISDSIDHISEDAIENSSAKLIPPNSVLMVIRSGILKRSLPVAINTVNIAINQDMKAFIASSKILAQYLLYFFIIIQNNILKNVRAVTADNIEFSIIRNMTIPLPPFSLQNQFATIVTKIEEQKALVKKAIDETQYLFDSLMSEYFE